jgi:hypothetical protein
LGEEDAHASELVVAEGERARRVGGLRRSRAGGEKEKRYDERARDGAISFANPKDGELFLRPKV